MRALVPAMLLLAAAHAEAGELPGIQLATFSDGNQVQGAPGSKRGDRQANQTQGGANQPNADAPSLQRFLDSIRFLGCIGCTQVPVISSGGGNGSGGTAGSGAPSAGGVGRNSSNFGH